MQRRPAFASLPGLRDVGASSRSARSTPEQPQSCRPPRQQGGLTGSGWREQQQAARPKRRSMQSQREASATGRGASERPRDTSAPRGARESVPREHLADQRRGGDSRASRPPAPKERGLPVWPRGESGYAPLHHSKRGAMCERRHAGDAICRAPPPCRARCTSWQEHHSACVSAARRADNRHLSTGKRGAMCERHHLPCPSALPGAMHIMARAPLRLREHDATCGRRGWSDDTRCAPPPRRARAWSTGVSLLHLRERGARYA